MASCALRARPIEKLNAMFGGCQAELEWRRHVNSQAAGVDRIGWLFNAIAYSLMIVLRHWLRQGQPGLALAAGTQPMLAGVLAALIAHRRWGRGFYIAWREALSLAALLHLQWSVRLLAVHSNENIMMHFQDGGSPLFLLVMLALNNALVWLLLSVFYSPAVTPVTTGLLSVAALSSLATTQPMCGKALEAPGVVQPLSELYSILTLAHFPAMHPGTADLLSSQSQTPEQQCMVISHWLNLAGGILFPVAVLWRTERRARRRFRRHMRQQYGQQQHPDADGALPGTQARWWECSILTDRGCRWLESPVLLFFMSNLIWIGAHAL